MHLLSIVAHRVRLEDLQNNITPYYAAHWIAIGNILGIHLEILQKIEASYPGDSFHCCNMMLEKWLDADIDATWDKIAGALLRSGVTKTISNLKQYNGMYIHAYIHT